MFRAGATALLLMRRAGSTDHERQTAKGGGGPTLPGSVSTAQGSKLELVGHFPLYGVVESMVVLKSRSPGSQRDALMLAFRSVMCARSSHQHRALMQQCDFSRAFVHVLVSPPASFLC